MNPRRQRLAKLCEINSEYESKLIPSFAKRLNKRLEKRK
jgi:hypothetical protein